MKVVGRIFHNGTNIDLSITTKMLIEWVRTIELYRHKLQILYRALAWYAQAMSELAPSFYLAI